MRGISSIYHVIKCKFYIYRDAAYAKYFYWSSMFKVRNLNTEKSLF